MSHAIVKLSMLRLIVSWSEDTNFIIPTIEEYNSIIYQIYINLLSTVQEIISTIYQCSKYLPLYPNLYSELYAIYLLLAAFSGAALFLF